MKGRRENRRKHRQFEEVQGISQAYYVRLAKNEILLM